MTDQELQIALAKMLPEKIYSTGISPYEFNWLDEHGTTVVRLIRDTEWLHACWLVEQTLTENQQPEYQEMLGRQLNHSTYKTRSASWQQRAEALMRVKGIQ